MSVFSEAFSPDTPDKLIVRGPLAVQMAAALNELYAKDKDSEETQVTIESMELDTDLSEFIEANRQQDPSEILYAIPMANVVSDTIVDLTNDLAVLNRERTTPNVLVDLCGESPNEQVRAIEQMVLAHKGHFFTSMESVLRHFAR